MSRKKLKKKSVRCRVKSHWLPTVLRIVGVLLSMFQILAA